MIIPKNLFIQMKFLYLILNILANKEIMQEVIYKYYYLHIFINTVNFMAIRSTWLSGFKICLNPKIKKENGYPVFKFFPKYLKFHSIPHSF